MSFMTCPTCQSMTRTCDHNKPSVFPVQQNRCKESALSAQHIAVCVCVYNRSPIASDTSIASSKQASKQTSKQAIQGV